MTYPDAGILFQNVDFVTLVRCFDKRYPFSKAQNSLEETNENQNFIIIASTHSSIIMSNNWKVKVKKYTFIILFPRQMLN